MSALHFELLVEEPSMEAFLNSLLPRLLPQDRSFRVYPFQGKKDLLGKLQNRLRGYAAWLPENYRVVVVVDRDEDDCHQLKDRLDSISASAGLRSRTATGDDRWQVVNRIAIEELEAWYFGDWEAVREVYSRVPANIPNRQGFRDPDAITGGTWEAFERILQRHRYFETGLRKVEAARALGQVVDPVRSTSRSFSLFCATLIGATP
ncbi:hypothetical protein CKO15_01885 [Halorhodospira abdelmalekii]|uniref:DUF4276 family protein n=1 Tax=Halorhodospira abdelmalekii TaxID=421629 RepID=UPI0019086691|nr:DUF4276 family protein [Halorhodospira abdelmalekii]MBK1734051.1 hypothetical protein [Halorhodospira abdelmalekii]